MTNINLIFCRAMLRGVHADVKRLHPTIKLKDAWVWTGGRDLWEFHGPDGYFWRDRADNAYEARAKGWMAWLRTNEEEK